MELNIQEQMRSLVSQKNYPCIAALQSYHRGEYQVGLYKDFGSGKSRAELAKDLRHFIKEQARTGSTYLSFWAVFQDGPGDAQAGHAEENFEKNLWQELSWLSTLDSPEAGWDPAFSSDPESESFCFSFEGKAIFVVGLHPESSRVSRRFPSPTLIFNVYDQFRKLNEEGLYQPMVQQNRKRDLLFQGSVNPMAEKHGDNWEAIQFSGKNNGSEWKCPFHKKV